MDTVRTAPHSAASMSDPAARSSPDRRWRMLILIFACRTGLGLQFQTLGSVSEPLVGQLGFSYTEIGTLIGLFMLPGLVLALPAGYAGRYLSDRTLVAFGLGSLALGGALASLAQGFGLLALGRIVAGAGFVFSTVYFAKMVTDWRLQLSATSEASLPRHGPAPHRRVRRARRCRSAARRPVATAARRAVPATAAGGGGGARVRANR